MSQEWLASRPRFLSHTYEGLAMFVDSLQEKTALGGITAVGEIGL